MNAESIAVERLKGKEAIANFVPHDRNGLINRRFKTVVATDISVMAFAASPDGIHCLVDAERLETPFTCKMRDRLAATFARTADEEGCP